MKMVAGWFGWLASDLWLARAYANRHRIVCFRHMSFRHNYDRTEFSQDVSPKKILVQEDTGDPACVTITAHVYNMMRRSLTSLQARALRGVRRRLAAGAAAMDGAHAHSAPPSVSIAAAIPTSSCLACVGGRRRSRNFHSSPSAPSNEIPASANVVIIGGGIIGTSVAYHLGKLGVPDVVLLEKDRLTSGTTWHAAGLINTFGSLSVTSTSMRRYTRDLYANVLPEETGMDCGFLPVGFIELAADGDRLEYYRRVAAFNRHCGVDVVEISPEEVKDRCPAVDVSDVLAGFYVEDDGRANPTDATMAFAKGARMNGVRILEGVAIDRATTTADEGGSLPKVTGVRLVSGETIKSNVVVNCAGMWARQLGQRNGVAIPNQAAEHYYLITEPSDAIDPSWPVVEDSSKCVYVRPEGGGLMLGLFESMGAPWNATALDGIPEDFSFGEINPDWDRMGSYLEEAMKRVPMTESLGAKGAKKFFCGPESFTPDGNPIVGEAAEVRNYYVAAGLNSIGILTGGGGRRHPSAVDTRWRASVGC